MQIRTTQLAAVVTLALVASGCDVSAECLPWFKGIACFQPDVGQECSGNEDTIRKVTVRPNSNDVVSDPGFENCVDFFCASTNGSRPYCTRRCESTFDCNGSMAPCLPGQPDCERNNWSCEVVIEFGELACKQTDETGGCETDPDTGKVKDPVKYCRANDGTMDVGVVNPPLDGGV